MALSFGELQTLWIQAGGPPSAAPVAAAVALAESSGIVDNTNPTDNGGTQTSWGLWQISDGTHNAPANWNDPLSNARMAVAKYQAAGNTFSRDWGTYSSGAYLKYLPGTVSAAVQTYSVASGYGSSPSAAGPPPASAAGTTPTAPAAAGTPGLFGPVIDAANTIATEVFLGAVALALLSGGILWLASTDSAVRSAVKATAV